MRTNIVNLAIDLGMGRDIVSKNQQFSKVSANDRLRKAFADEFGIEKDEKGKYTIDDKTFRRHKVEIFEIIEEVINETLHEGLKSQFDGFAEYRNLAWGDTNLFKVPANNIFRVALVSDGNSNIRRQNLRDGSEFSVDLDTYAIKIGEDFHRFLAGRVDWSELTAGIAESFRRDMTQRIYKAVMASYGRYNDTYHTTVNKTDLGGIEDELLEMAMHIKARTGEAVTVYGTLLALRQVAPKAVTETMQDRWNEVGFYGKIAGIELREIEQSHEYGTDEFAISNDFILVLPQNHDRMVKIVNEGNAIIQDQQGGQTADMMKEYFIANKFGVSIITAKVFGFIKFT